ncbi:YfgM family protein [Candidatus Pantoea edessiphila]|uniref:Ancillary SecYEG translocon subunit n=1 Tax=Candidatus Pantoea edessiphila TaxID=2044610 RepID=A0A2P5SWJ4_9GAMM|nr:tetratricopeptide repeat protein [Candidatus Pantoea edessiphila]PPI86681.1 hypothetical protein CRV10_00240 [Candidatus Pantoea edessiphila]
MHSNETKTLNIIKEFIYKKKKILMISIIFFISMCMFIISGWLFVYQKSNENVITTKDLLEQYQRIISSLQVNQSKNFLSELSLKEIDNFIYNNKNVYGSMVGMILAKHYIIHNKFDKAILSLKTILKFTKDINLQSLINLRLARIQIEQNKFDEALKTLDCIKDDSWSVVASDLRGEILFSKGNKDLAKKEWNKISNSNISPIYNQIIQMKINK